MTNLSDSGVADRYCDGGDVKALEIGSRARFFFVEDPDGYKIEVLGRSGRLLKIAIKALYGAARSRRL